MRVCKISARLGKGGTGRRGMWEFTYGVEASPGSGCGCVFCGVGGGAARTGVGTCLGAGGTFGAGAGTWLDVASALDARELVMRVWDCVVASGMGGVSVRRKRGSVGGTIRCSAAGLWSM